MAVELATAYLSIIPETSKLAPGIKKGLGEAVGDADRAGKSAGRRFSGAMGRALKVGVKAAGGAAAVGLGTALVKGFQRLTALDEANAKLEGLGHSADTVQKIMDNALASVKGTAFGMGEAATTAAGAVAAGIKPGKDLESVLALVADAATIAGTDMGSMGAIFNKVATSGKVQGEVIAQLSERGIPIIQLLSEQLGVSAEETYELASQGKINFETFRKAMEEGMGGAAQESGKTFTGAMKNVMASVGRIGANLLSGVFPHAKDWLLKIQEWLSPVEDVASDVGKAIGDMIEKAGPFFEKLWESAKPVLDKLLPKIQEFAPKLSPLLLIFEALAPLLPQIWDTIEQIAPSIMEIVKTVASVMEEIGPVLASMAAEVLPIVLDLVKEVAPLLADLIKELLPPLANLALQLLPILPPLLRLVVWGLDMLMDGFRFILPVIKGLITWGINPLILGFQWVADGIEKLRNGEAMAWLQSVWGTLKDTIRLAWDKITEKLWASWTWVKGTFRRAWDGLKGIVMTPIDNAREAVGKALDKIKDTFTSVRDSIGDIWDGLKDRMAGPVKWVADHVVNPLIKGFNKIANAVNIPTLPEWSFSFASGGVMPGYTPGRDVHHFVSPTGGQLHLSGGEAIMRPEWTRAVGGPAAVAAMNAAARRGQAFAGGGVFQPVPGHGNRHSGYPWASWAGDFPVPFGTPIHAWKDGIVAAVRRLTYSYGKHVRINHDDGTSSLYAHMSRILVDLGQRVRAGQVIGKVGSTGNSTGPHLHFETMGGPYRGGSSGGGLKDLFAGFTSPLAWLKDLITAPLGKLSGAPGGFWGDVIAGLPGLIKDGMLDKISLFDDGGWLQPGHLAYNGLSRPEPVFTPAQWDKINAGGGVTVHGDVYGATPPQVVAELEKQKRRAAALRPVMA